MATDTTNETNAGGNLPVGNITSETVSGNTTPITLPQTPTPTPVPVVQTEDTATDPSTQAYNDYVASTKANAPSATAGADLYNTDVNNAGISGLQTGVNVANTAVTQEQANLDAINAQLKGIQNTNTAANLKLEGDAGTGYGTAGFTGKQQAENNRQAGIASLNLQSQALVSQAKIQSLQGNATAAQTLLTQAQQNVDKLFSIQSQDLQNTQTYNQKLIDTAYQYATDAQKAKLDAAKVKNDQDFQLQRDKINNDYDTQKILLQNSLKTPSAPTVQKINGVDMQWDGKTWQPIGGTGQTNVESLAQAQENITNVSDLLKSGGIGSSVGTSFLSRTPTGSGFWGTLGKIAATIIKAPLTFGIGTVKDTWSSLSGEKQNFIAGTEQLQSQLSLDSLIQAKAKGATFGALSDAEMRILSQSASKLGNWAIKDNKGNVVAYNTTEKAFKQELDKINNFAKLDYLLKGGNPEDVGVKQQEDGTYWTQNSDGSYTQLQ